MTVEIVAEIAQGYEGDPTLARLLAKGAVAAGADAVKFQIVFAEELAVPGYKYYDLFRQLEMPTSAWEAAAHVVRSAGKRLYFDVYGPKSLEYAQRLGADGVKIHSTDFFNTELHDAALSSMPCVFVSFGGIAMDELTAFLNAHSGPTLDKISLLFGFQAEPTPVESNNLLRLAALKQHFPNIRFGFMDHACGNSDEGQTLALLALPLGISCIEKHLTLDRLLELEDYPSALAPQEFSQFVSRVRRLETALGSSNLALTEQETGYRQRAVKVITAATPLQAGTRLTRAHVSLLRVADPVHPAPLSVADISGKTLSNTLAIGQQITWEDLA